MRRPLLQPAPSLLVFSPFGVVLEGRSWSGGSGYRYGFQAQEQDAELWEGAVNYKYRVEDPRLVRFFSVDPLKFKYPANATYAFCQNNVIQFRELEGMEPDTEESTDASHVEANACGEGISTEEPQRSIKISFGAPIPFVAPFTTYAHRVREGTFWDNSNGRARLYNSPDYLLNPMKFDEPANMIKPIEITFENSDGSATELNITGYHRKYNVSDLFHPSGGINEVSINYCRVSKPAENFFKFNLYGGGGFGFLLTRPSVHGDKKPTENSVGYSALDTSSLKAFDYQPCGYGGSVCTGIQKDIKVKQRHHFVLSFHVDAFYFDTSTFQVRDNSTGEIVYSQDLKSLGYGMYAGIKYQFQIR